MLRVDPREGLGVMCVHSFFTTSPFERFCGRMGADVSFLRPSVVCVVVLVEMVVVTVVGTCRMSGGLCMLVAYLVYAVFVLPRTGGASVAMRSLLDFQVLSRSFLSFISLRLSLALVPLPHLLFHGISSTVYARVLTSVVVVGPRSSKHGRDSEFSAQSAGEEGTAAHESVERVDCARCVSLSPASPTACLAPSIPSHPYTDSTLPLSTPLYLHYHQLSLPLTPTAVESARLCSTHSNLNHLPHPPRHPPRLRRLQTPRLLPHFLSAFCAVEY